MYNVGYQFVSPVGIISPLLPPLVPLAGSLSSANIETGAVNQRAHTLMSMSCLRLRGLPFSARIGDIVDFLGQCSNAMVGAVHIIYNLQVRYKNSSFHQEKSNPIHPLSHSSSQEESSYHVSCSTLQSDRWWSNGRAMVEQW